MDEGRHWQTLYGVMVVQVIVLYRAKGSSQYYPTISTHRQLWIPHLHVSHHSSSTPDSTFFAMPAWSFWLQLVHITLVTKLWVTVLCRTVMTCTSWTVWLAVDDGELCLCRCHWGRHESLQLLSATSESVNLLCLFFSWRATTDHEASWMNEWQQTGQG